MKDEALLANRPKAFETIVYGGFAIGILDFFDASTFFPLYHGIGFTRVWQSVAAGVLGHDMAVAGGWNTALLGIVLHFAVAFCIAVVYYLASSNIPFLIRRPIVSGIVYGVIAAFCNAIRRNTFDRDRRPAPFTIGWPLMNSIVGHVSPGRTACCADRKVVGETPITETKTISRQNRLYPGGHANPIS